jgi:hypothetical protein
VRGERRRYGRLHAGHVEAAATCGADIGGARSKDARAV